MSKKDETILIVANWHLLKPLDADTTEILKNYVADVKAAEPDTLIYRLHIGNTQLNSLPVVSDTVITFIEMYKDMSAFMQHLAPGSPFVNMVQNYGDKLFYIPNSFLGDGAQQNPLNTAQFFDRVAGFIRNSEPDVQ